MDFSTIFQLRTKRYWWMDVIFYFAISLLIATVLCYVIFLVKNSMQRKQTADEVVKLQGVGTSDQKEQEQEVLTYQKKIADFTGIFKNHEFASNVFAFMQAQTLPNAWFKQFSFDTKSLAIQLNGETDDYDAVSRQVAILEKNEYVKVLGSISTASGQSARNDFNFSITLDPKILSYNSDIKLKSNAVLLEDLSMVQPDQNNITPAATVTESAEKLITAFHLLLTPDVAGVIDQTNYTVKLNVPYGTDLTKLTPSIIVSSGATVSPVSNISQDFTNAVNYTITAGDSSTQIYKVTVSILPKVIPQKAGMPVSAITAIAFIIAIIIAVALTVFFIWRKNKIQKPNI